MKSQWTPHNYSSAAPALNNKNTCNKCGVLGWTPQHRCNTARRDDSVPYFAGLSTGDNAAAEIAIPATASQLDTAISELIVAVVAKQAQLCNCTK